MKKVITSLAVVFFAVTSFAQNLQLHYDFGKHMYDGLEARPNLTTTFELFRADGLGSTYLFVDLDYSKKAVGAYTEISREFCFWPNTKMDWLSIHLEYNGGLVTGGSFNNAWLAGLTYSGHSKDFTKTWSLTASYKAIPGVLAANGNCDMHNFQITGVWGITFAKGWCSFDGFIDVWRQHNQWLDSSMSTIHTSYVWVSEPQFWVNFNKIKGWEKVNLSLGTEVRLSYNFVGNRFYAIPTAAAKWSF